MNIKRNVLVVKTYI